MDAHSDHWRGRRGRAAGVESFLRFVAAKLEPLALSSLQISSSVCYKRSCPYPWVTFGSIMGLYGDYSKPKLKGYLLCC